MDLALIIFGIGTLFVRLAQTLFLAGSTRSKNSGSSILRMILDMALGALLFYFIGDLFLPKLGEARRFFLLTALLTGTCVPLCAASERIKLYPVFIPTLLLASILSPLFIRWTQFGFLSSGFKDFGAAASIHLPAGIAAFAMMILVGPRMGKYNKDGSSNAIPGHSLPITSIGLLLTLLGWFPYLLGFIDLTKTASFADIATNLLIAVSAGTLASAVFSHFRFMKLDIHVIFTGLLGSMVAITPLANTPHAWIALLVGVIAGVAVPFALLNLDLLFKIDDVTGSGSIHGIGALVGLILAPIFDFSFKALLYQFLGLAFIIVMSAVCIGAALYFVNKTWKLRSKEADEFDGLDLADHDINSWPDFQQTMIKSYHLREA